MAYFTTLKTFDYLFCRIFMVLGFVLVIILVFLIMFFWISLTKWRFSFGMKYFIFVGRWYWHRDTILVAKGT